MSGKASFEISDKSPKKALPLTVNLECNPYKHLPNCRKFEIFLNKQDELFEIFGIFERLKEAASIISKSKKIYKAIKVAKRHPPKIVIHPLGNKSINRFIDHVTKRLNTLAKENNGKTF